ncbi:Carotenoid ester lipase precursor [Mycena kentingensis (nom. inval.)]|nr:Carotenoid ester lipase precursor [Mycena kentingensis (nom. inval.)]
MGDYVFIGARRFFLQHASTTQHPGATVLNKRGKSTPVVGAQHGGDMSMWFPPSIANTTDFTANDALINFVTTLDPNGRKDTNEWPTYTLPTKLLLTFSDLLAVNVTKDDFREEAMGWMYDTIYKYATRA